MPYPDKLLADDEEVVRHLHPHWSTVARPLALLFLVVGGASYAAALVPAGDARGTVRLALLGVAAALVVVFVAGPLLRRRCTHYVITTHRLLFREGVLSRHGRDIGLSRITDVSYRQTLRERVLGSGTLTIESAGDAGPTVLHRIPDSDGVAQLLAHMIEEDAERRAWPGAGHPTASL
ncbi:PH domain-containing protein [Geodermatophilus sp. SYSU D00758]